VWSEAVVKGIKFFTPKALLPKFHIIKRASPIRLLVLLLLICFKKLTQKLKRVGVGSLHVLNNKIFKKAYSNVGKPTKCATQQHSTARRTGCLTVLFISSFTDLDHNFQHVSFICIIHSNIFYCMYNNFYLLIFYTYLYDTLLTVN
jgi:branched-subunit amino acid transport protein AzlD